MRRLPRIAIAAVAATTVSGVAFAGTASAAPSRTTLNGNQPAWAQSKALRGAATGSDPIGLRVYLGWRNSAQAEALATAVSTPGNASYGKYLTPAQFHQQFAPTAADVAAVEQWLTGAGLTVDYVPDNNHYVAVEGTVAQANAAFATTLGVYSYKGKNLRAPETAPSVPAGLPALSGVLGLDDNAELVHPDHDVADAPPSGAFVNAGPLSSWFGQTRVSDQPSPYGTALPTQPDYSYAVKGYTPAQLRGAYGLTGGAGADGSGVTVAVIDAYASPTILQDAQHYAQVNDVAHPLSSAQFSQHIAPGTLKRPQNSRQDPQGWYGEETLDVEAVHAMAPGANILYVGAPNNYQDLDAAVNDVVDHKLATIVTNSWGNSTEDLPPGDIKPLYDTTVQAAAQGIGVYFSSGDDGDETYGSGDPAAATPDWPASDPWVTAVGGTALAVGSGSTYQFENGWQTSTATLKNGAFPTPTYLYGAGGGTSRLFTQPAYQRGVVPTSIATGTTSGGRAQPMRTVPDVAAVADPNTGMLVGQTQTYADGSQHYGEYRIGGTSLASPLFAGVMAVAQQRLGRTIGFANPRLYAVSAAAFNDVLPDSQAQQDRAVVRVNYVNGQDGSNGYSYILRTLGDDAALTIHTAPGYDDVTGRGSPKAGSFLPAVAGR